MGRFGGDEFLIVLCETREPDALELADRLRSRLPLSICLSGGLELSLDLAVGVTAVRPDERLDAALPRADAQMYRDKRRSRRPAPSTSGTGR